MRKESAEYFKEISSKALSKCKDNTGKNLTEIKVVERFLTYVSFDTGSDSESTTFPSTERQKDLGHYLEAEFTAMGLEDVDFDEHGYVYATLKASPGMEDHETLALIAHMDVTDQAPNEDTHTIINAEDGQNVIRTDGRTLLGGDDKAGLSEIVTAVEELISHPEYRHPELRIVVTPDEEVGAGTKMIDLKKINASYAYTIDGEAIGELNYETWNAAKATVEFTGVVIHAGIAFGVMKNTVLMAADFINMLPADETPATTRGRKGFYYADNLKADTAYGRMVVDLRDFEHEGLDAKKKFITGVCEKINEKYGEGSCRITIEDVYPNMKEYIMPDNEFLVQHVRDTYEELDIELLESPIRGGTDGSNLSRMGLPTPNLGTGTKECHSVKEHIAVEDLQKMVEVIIKLVGKF